MLDFIIRSLAIGVAATAILDLWALFLNRGLGLPASNWGLIGRWFLHLPSGKFAHENIAASPGFAHEKAAGWTAHYLIGVLFAAITLLIAGAAWAKNPTLPPPLIVGIVTVGCGWFILQPGTGAGIAASKRPDAMRARIISLVNHTVFGLGMFAAAWAIKSL
jgi:hypothetical protein